MDKLAGYDWGSMLKSVTNKVKQYTLNLSDLELKVEDATSNETWGPHGSVMSEIAEASFDFESYKQIMGVIARRLQEKEENWRMCYKALLLLEYLVKHGPMKVVHDISGSAAVLDRLTNFEYKDPNGKDHGVNVRHRAKELLQLVNNPDRVREERHKAKANKAKYTGVSAAEMRSGGFGSSTSGFGNGGGSSSFRSGPSTQRMYNSGGGGGGSGLGGGLGSSRGSGFGSSGSGGVLGGGGASSSFTRGGRVSQEDVEEDYHYISKRATGSEEGEADPVAATRARIDALKLSGKADSEEKAAAEGEQRKKLGDVKVNPKIAASLGLKIAAPTPAATAPASQPAAAAPAAASNQVNLLGGLSDDPAPAAGSTAATDLFDALGAPAPAAATAAAPASGGGWDAFAGLDGHTSGAAEPVAAAGAAGGWDAFGGTSAARAAPAAVTGSAPLDLFGGLAAPAPTPSAPAFDPFAAPAAPKAASPAAAPAPAAAFDPFAQPAAASPAGSAGVAASKPAFDPFADFAASPGAPATAADPFEAPAAAAAPAPARTTAASPPAAAGAKAHSLGRPLPEDMFSDLTGLNREAKPMGSRKGLHMDLPPFPAAPQPASAAPPSAGAAFPAAGFAGGPTAGLGPRGGPVVLDPRTGQPVMLVPVPVGLPGQPLGPQHGQPGGLGSFPLPAHHQQQQQQQQQQGGLPGFGQQQDLSGLLGGGGSVGSAAAAPPVKLGASPKKDPFADLLG